MTHVLISNSQYTKALAAIKKQMATGLLRAKKDLEYQILLTRWQTGCIIQCDILGDRSEPERGSALYERLSSDLGVELTALKQSVRIFQTFPDKPKKDGLNWSHYVMLVRVSDPRKRLSLKKRILREHLTNPDLRRIVKELERPKDFIINKGRLKVQRGKLYHYRIREVESVDGRSSKLEIDGGFDISIDKPASVKASLGRGKIIRFLKEGDAYTAVQTRAQPPADLLYTYRTTVKRVVDADTLIVKVDVGFGVHIRQRLRLRGIDAPEIGTAAGREAKAYVQAVLAKCPCPVIKTYGSDKYDRYLVDVFVLPNSRNPHDVAAKGKLLNQMLLDEGLARVWEG